ncbi:50S ribosomal protein L9 [Candidatus Tachikawaea gelatinosa]|uniref:Large ribosomal subunit protein bL9 n=1 Tax=Candidatus Tachikawaea gelatinosa TaxID=1410383 RepID=A0A090AIS4_9ENTR|nr:50S ribosomal protein L9 [Candidatus Tachikawaea gelatinosa]BAP58303.1 50S ribosomal protein L9 [Candidatus Tachikawaea gelatinosa]
MDIILINKLKKLGNFGDHIKVKSGYARNFLIPKGKAISATQKNIKNFKNKREELEKKSLKMIKNLQQRAEKIKALGEIIIKAKVGKKGKLFGSVNAKNIKNALFKIGIIVEKNEIKLTKNMIRVAGKHEVQFNFQNNITASIFINIIPE